MTGAFLTCIYLGVTAAAVSVGLLSDVMSLFAAVTVVAAVVATVAAVVAMWHWGSRALAATGSAEPGQVSAPRPANPGCRRS